MNGRKAALLILFVLSSPLAFRAQSAESEAVRHPLNVRPTDRLTMQIDEERRVTLSGSRHPLAKPANMIGEVSPDQPMESMVLVLRPDPSQEEALQELLRAQQDPASPYYHQWLSPKAFGERFGISQNDLYQVKVWLETQGMKVDEVPLSRRTIVFSGTAGDVETAFHTQMREYSVEGKVHFANATDPEIPQALAGVVRGIVSLHDFRSVPAHVTVPAYTTANGSTFLMPQDWDTIYDVTPLYSQGLDGTGQSIAVVGRQDISLADVATFRTNAGLPNNPANVPQKIFVNGVNPGFTWCDDEEEAALDVDWAGAIAKNASIKFVSAQSGATDGVVLAAQFAVNHNVAPIVSVSYLHCENTLSDGGQSLWGALWSQANAQGQSIFVASGDTGAAGCDAATQKTATQGKSVNAICSTPNSTCVGGTEFNDTYNPGVYWLGTNGTGMSSALSYIPELAWNEDGWSGMLGTASGGGISSFYLRPSWQSGPGVPAGTQRLVPDVAASSAVHDAYVLQVQGKPFYGGGTSAAAPSMASVMAIVLQNAGGTLGNVNPALYTLASQQAAGGPAVFHDITSGNNSVPGVTGYNAGPGYDMVTGLGSVDAFLLVNSWSNIRASNFTLATSSSSLTVSPSHSTNATLTMSAQGGFSTPVTLSAAGAPTGVTVTFSSPTLTSSARVTMTVTAAANALAGTFPIAIAGSGGGFERTVAFALTFAAPTFTLTPSPTGASVNVGSSTSYTLTIARLNGFSSPVVLSVSGAPQGVTTSFSPISITSGNSSILTVSVGSTVAAGVSSLTVTGTSGSITQTQTIILSVANPNYTLVPSATSASVALGGAVPTTVTTTAGTGFNSIVYLSISGLPSGVTASFTKTSIPAPGNGSSTLTLSVASTATPGTYTLTLGAVGGGAGKTVPFSLTVLPPASFTLTPSATSASVAPGGSTPITLTTARVSGFTSAVALSISGLPGGVTASFTPTGIAWPGSGSSTLTLSVAATAATGTCTLTVTATGGGVTKTQTLSLTVLPPSFTLTPSATSLSVAPGGSIPATLTTARVNGFTSAVALSISGLPTGVTGSFAPASIASPGSGSSTLTLSAGSGTVPGASTLTVTAKGGGVTKTQTLSLIVLTPSFTLTPTLSTASVAAGGSKTMTLTTAPVNGFQASIALSVTGLAKGVTASFTPTSIASSGTSTLKLSVASGTAVGTCTLTVMAAGGGVSKTQAISLTY